MTPVALTAVVVAAVVVAHVLLVVAFTASLVMPNPLWRFTRRDRPETWGVDAETVTLPNGCPAFYVRHQTSSQVVLVCHGRSRHRRWMLPLIARLARSRSVLAPDFPGHGESRYRATTVGLREADAVDVALDWLRARGHQRILVYGVSMGGAAAILALGRRSAAARGVEALVTDGAFDALTTVVDHVLRWFPWVPRYLRAAALWAAERVVGSDPRRVRPVDAAPGLDVPATFLHGRRDWLVPRACVERLAAAYADPGAAVLYDGAHDVPANLVMHDAVEAAFAGAGSVERAG